MPGRQPSVVFAPSNGDDKNNTNNHDVNGYDNHHHHRHHHRNHRWSSISKSHTDENDDNDDGETIATDFFWEEAPPHVHTPPSAVWKTSLLVLCVTLNSCSAGYSIGVNTDAGIPLQHALQLSSTQLELFMGSLSLYCLVGALLAPLFAENYGRKWTILFSALCTLVGTFIMCLAQGYSILMAGRFFVGVGVGTGLVLNPMYISEISPAEYRGEFVTWAEIATNLGILLGFASGLLAATSGSDNVTWRLMFGMGMVISVTVLVCVTRYLPESPRWLLAAQRPRSEAQTALEQLYPEDYDVTDLLHAIEDSIAQEKMSAGQSGGNANEGWRAYVRLFCCPSPALRRMLMAGVGAALASQLSGIDTIQYYLVYLLQDAGWDVDGSPRNTTYVLVGLGALKVALIFVAGRLIDHWGRRPLLMMSTLGMMISLQLLAVNLYWNGGDNPTASESSPADLIITMVALAGYLSSYSLGVGPCEWLIASEVFSLSIRSVAMSVTVFLNRMTGFVLTSTFFSLSHLWGPAGYLGVLSLVNLGLCIFVYLYIPETKGRNLEEMVQYFAQVTGDVSVLSPTILDEEEVPLKGKPVDHHHDDDDDDAHLRRSHHHHHHRRRRRQSRGTNAMYGSITQVAERTRPSITEMLLRASFPSAPTSLHDGGDGGDGGRGRGRGRRLSTVAARQSVTELLVRVSMTRERRQLYQEFLQDEGEEGKSMLQYLDDVDAHEFDYHDSDEEEEEEQSFPPQQQTNYGTGN